VTWHASIVVASFTSRFITDAKSVPRTPEGRWLRAPGSRRLDRPTSVSTAEARAAACRVSPATRALSLTATATSPEAVLLVGVRWGGEVLPDTTGRYWSHVEERERPSFVSRVP
jgi:hypothetical protein